MSDSASESGSQLSPNLSDDQVLRLLDLATEVLEGLDELGVATRSDLLALMDQLERLVRDES